ncbi:MAG: alpha/beta fold hydrolase [Betaproteobacteria bacterium]|nr:alpha/beta fold hydrolase [Betaproteobacteria bacterium]
MTLHVDRFGAGPDLVLLHGWALHGGAWSEVAGRLAARFRLHVIDLPGHGLSPGLPFTDLESLAAQVAPAVPNGSAICGWSLGALVAMHLSTVATLGIRALGLVAATPSFVTREGWISGIAPPVLEEFRRNLGLDRSATVRAFLQLNARGASGARACVRRLEAMRDERPAPAGVALAAGLDVLATADLRARTAAIAQPAVVIHGLRDELVPADAGRLLAAAMPNARFVGIDDAAHAVLLTHAEALTSALESIDG